MNTFRALSVGLLVAAGACGGPQKLGGAGATCFRDDDCKPGMVCVAPTAGDIHRVCSSDPTPLISMVEGPPAMAAAGAATMPGAGGDGDVAGTAGGGGTPGGAGGSAGGGATGGNTTSGSAAGGNAASGSAAGGNATSGSAAGGSAGSAGAAAGGTATAGTGGTDSAGSSGTSGTAGTMSAAGAPP